jgi:RNA polymerase sigma-70 factor (ECF subfamily)
MLMEQTLEGSLGLSADGEDLDLVYRVQQGDLGAFAELVTKYRNGIYARIYRMTQNQEDAMEITLLTFVKVWRGIPKFNGKSSFYTWLYRVATHEAIDWLQRNRPLFVKLDTELRSSVAPPDRQIQRKEVRQFVTDAVAKLSPKHRAVIVLRDLENLQYGEIAQTLECSIATVMSRLFHARRNLQTLLRPLSGSHLKIPLCPTENGTIPAVGDILHEI